MPFITEETIQPEEKMTTGSYLYLYIDIDRQIYFRVTNKLQNREPKEITAITNFNTHPMHQFEAIINLISYNFMTNLMPQMFLLKGARDASL